MQRKINEWEKTQQPAEQKYWKRYKRWEHEMLMHTNGHGEPGSETSYQQTVVKAAAEKQSKKKQDELFSATAWSPTGPYNLPDNLTGYMENGMGRINCIAFHPTDSNTYFVGVAQGGVWKTTNNGVSWVPLTDQLPILRISDICIDPVDPNIMYISVCDFAYIDVALNIDGRKRNTHYGLGVFKTTDGGMTWQATGLSFTLINKDYSLIRKVLVNPVNHNQLVACGVSGMYTSSNGGNTWNHVMDTLMWDLVQDPANPQTLYAASGWLYNSNYGYAGIYKSTDFGASWNLLNTNIAPSGAVQRIKIAIAASDPNYVYALAVDDSEGTYGIYKSTDAGNSWQLLQIPNILGYDDGSSPGGQGTYDLAFTVDHTDKNKLYAGGINVWVSEDGGTTFNPASHWTLNYGNTIHGDIHFIETQPLTGNIFVCSDGGVYRTNTLLSQTWSDASNGNPWPTNWLKITNGMNITSFYRISSSKNTTGRLMAGAQDNASFYYDGNSWSTIFGGDGMDNWLDPVNDNMVIGSAQYGYFYVSDDGGVNYGISNPNLNWENGEWVSPITADPSNTDNLYAGFINITKSDDAGYSWTDLSPVPTNGIYDNELCALAVAASNGNVIYAARRVRYEFGSPGSLLKTTNGGNSWTDITFGLPDSLYITSLDVSQSNADIIYVSFAGLIPGFKVFKSVDGGSTWQNISYNLPNIPVNCIKTTPVSNQLMIATDIGLYVLDISTNNWVNQSNGLPNVILSDIEFNMALNKIYVATFGRGIWENNLSSVLVNHNGNEDGAVWEAQLFPSPANGQFTIKLGKDFNPETELFLQLVDVTGKAVHEEKLKGKNSYPVQVNLPAGLYYARLQSTTFSGVKELIIK